MKRALIYVGNSPGLCGALGSASETYKLLWLFDVPEIGMVAQGVGIKYPNSSSIHIARFLARRDVRPLLVRLLGHDIVYVPLKHWDALIRVLLTSQEINRTAADALTEWANMTCLELSTK